jgi:uncharacterized membrane protein YfcA
MTDHLPLWVPVGVAVIALVYSFVGHGGASGYLALLALSPLLPREIAVTALIINLVVAGTSFVLYQLAHYFSWRLAWPFLVGSLPLAFIGSIVKVSDTTYYRIVGAFAIATGRSSGLWLACSC